MLKVESIVAAYGKMKALHGVSFEVQPNSITALIGPNGAGKTTTLKTIMGMLSLSAGTIEFNGEDITRIASHLVIQHGICLIPEDRKLFPYMTVQENLVMGAFNRRSWKSRHHGLDRVYELFPRLKERHRQSAKTLSGGEQRMLAVGRGMMSEPKLLILDEPSLGLAPKIVSEIFKVIEHIQNENVSILLVEQNVAKTLQISHNAYVIENGSIVMEGGKELLGTAHIRKAYLRI